MSFLHLTIGYLFGWIEGALIISKNVGKFDIREKGSGNAGASNVTDVMGWRYGIAVALIDILKAFIPLTIAKIFFNASFTNTFFMGFGVFLGHIFPLPFDFKGGKGAASFIGFMYALDLKLGLFMNLLFIFVAFISNHVFVGSLSMFFIFPFILLIYKAPVITFFISILIAIIGLYKHMINIHNLKLGKDKGLREALKKLKK
ncbi:MAG: glycerol-3-phosphate acyltransferase [Clostridiales bacterium]|nr:glycerol-3-phosphate acyltransferase [Clostridiales bacterium]